MKIAIITGGSRGIGAAAATTLAKAGYAVCITYLSAKEKADAVVQSIQAQGGHAMAFHANTASEEDVMRLFTYVDEKWGPVTALVNNAGTNGGICQVENITLNRLTDVFATNVFGTFIACREAIKRMKMRGSGAIVNISSEAAKFGGNQLAHYAASKAAINTLTIGLAREVAPYHIRVNAVSPGVIDTDIHAASPLDRIANLLKSIPMGRMGEPQEVANTISWLLSDAASYVSGAVIPVTGSR
ncbi:MAG TPA: SDR family oxidoreductase [Gammaproteobacteria bacterium]|jgi:NAD(P)-dependent dehydrogenase (short-subunit alcohol dehydrogenase family)|nr:SDR family oxidoreductase [Gammaproteobacteria bacterium]